MTVLNRSSRLAYEAYLANLAFLYIECHMRQVDVDPFLCKEGAKLLDTEASARALDYMNVRLTGTIMEIFPSAESMDACSAHERRFAIVQIARAAFEAYAEARERECCPLPERYAGFTSAPRELQEAYCFFAGEALKKYRSLVPERQRKLSASVLAF